MTDRRASVRLLAALATAMCLTTAMWTGPLAAQTSEDLPPTTAVHRIASADLEDDRTFEIEDLLWQADQLVGNDSAAAADLYSRAIELAAPGGTVPLPGDTRSLLIKAYLGRAAAQLERRQKSAAEADLSRILQIDPDIELTGESSTGEAVALFKRLRTSSLGSLDLSLEPGDAEVFIAGRPLTEPGRRHHLPPGEYELSVRRPGFAGERRSIGLTAGKRSDQRFELHRTSAAIHFGIRPAGAWLELDDRRLPVAGPEVRCRVPGAGLAELPTLTDAARGSDSPQMDCLIGGLTPGRHQIRIGGDGWRQRELNLEVEQLSDLRYPDVQLDRTSATLVLTGMPTAARITLDEIAVEVPTDAADGLRLATIPGPHEIVVNTGGQGLFRTSVTLTDQQVLQLVVEPQPSISLVGVFGPDRVAASDLAVELAGKAETLDGWTFLDRSSMADEVARATGLDVQRLRALAASPVTVGEPDWAQIQQQLDREMPASLHLFAVLDDLSYARHADLWLMAAAPGPARPVRLRIDLAGDTRAAALLPVLAPPLTFSRLRLGADFIDLPDVSGATAIQVSPDGPAAAAGLQVGQTVTRLGDHAITDVAALRSVLARTDAGTRLPIELHTESVEITVEIEPASGPVILSPSASRQLYPALWARLEWAARRRPVESWVLDLDRAALYLAAGDWDAAAAYLRRLDAPQRAGVGAGTAHYWLGRALTAGGAAPSEEAAAAFAAAAEPPPARLENDGGPLVAPRARIHLQDLRQTDR